jgi:hypothetical protein
VEKPPISRLGVLYLSLGLAQAAHSVEEMLTHLYDFFWIVSGALHRTFAWYPQSRWPADLFGAINMVLIAVLLGSWPFVERRDSWVLYLAGAAGVIETLNGINHLAAAAVFRGYVPGAITAPVLLVLGPLVLRELRRSGKVAVPSSVPQQNP